MDINEETTEFYRLLGLCIAQWSHVEDALFTNFRIAISEAWQSSNMPAQAAFYAIQSPEGKIRMTDSAVKFRLLMGMSDSKDDQRRKFVALWDKICANANQKRKRRNLLAHFQVLNHHNNVPGKRVQLRAPLFNPNVLFQSSQRYWHCAELDATRNSFGKLWQDLVAFSEGFAELLGQHTGPLLKADDLANMLRELGDLTYEGPGLDEAGDRPDGGRATSGEANGVTEPGEEAKTNT
jgi:hypothetical protein